MQWCGGLLQCLVAIHHLHHELQGQAATTTHWLHQLTIGAIYKDRIIHSKCGQTFIQTLHTEFLLHFHQDKKTQSWCWLAIKRQVITKENSILIQAATSSAVLGLATMLDCKTKANNRKAEMTNEPRRNWNHKKKKPQTGRGRWEKEHGEI
jgi:hypothetical protein